MSLGSSGLVTFSRNWASSRGRGRVELVLVLQRVDDLVHQRHAEARDLRVVALGVLALGRRPDADDRLFVRLGDEAVGDLQGDGVDVVALERVVADLGEVPAVQQVEDAQVQEERVVGLPGERLRAARRACGSPACAACRSPASTPCRRSTAPPARRRRPSSSTPPSGLQLDQLDVVRLRDVEVRVVEALDRTRVVQERLLVLRVRLERVAEQQVFLRVTVAVDAEVVLRRPRRT